MGSLFTRREWKHTTLRELEGEEGNLRVVMRNFPCLVDIAGGAKTYAYRGFGSEFIEELSSRQIGSFDEVRRILDAGVKHRVLVTLRGHGPIEVEISGRAPATSRSFYSDVAEAIATAFRSAGVRP